MTAGGQNPAAGGPNFSSGDARDRADAALERLAGHGEPTRLFVPGRIEVLGKHTDYAGGHSVTCAAQRGFSVSYVPRDDDRVRLVDARDGRQVDFRIDAGLTPEIGHWSNYPMTVARRLAQNFGPLDRGADIAFFGTLPKSAGLSTSSALITAVFLAIAGASRLFERAAVRAAIPDGLHMAGYLGCIENGRAFGLLEGDHGVGTAGGNEDHTAILLSQSGDLTRYRYHPVSPVGRVPLDSAYVFVVAASGIAAAKTGTARDKYNRASDLVSELVAIGTALNSDRRAELRFRSDGIDRRAELQFRSDGVDRRAELQFRSDSIDRRAELQFRHTDALTLSDLLDSAPEAADDLRAALAERAARFPAVELQRRLEHFMTEDRMILPAAFSALAEGRVSDFGTLVDRSQRAAEDLLGNQVPETITLAQLARELGAHAASSFGAGFGGSVWALVEAAGAEGFRDRWLAAYASRHPDAATRSTAFLTRPGPGAHTLG